MNTTALVDHFFRHEYGKLVATLCRRFGTKHLELVEDAVQNALMHALETWPVAGVPENRSAWLFRVASNALVDDLRRTSRQSRILESDASVAALRPALEWALVTEAHADDDMLRLLFVCCEESIPLESQLVFALKTLCGFDVREIAQRLFTSEANIYKRYARARDRLRTLPMQTDALISERFASRLPAVHQVIYQLFNEGYLSATSDFTIRQELCADAIRLGELLAGHAVGDTPETAALLALMFLHAARAAARTESGGGLLLLEEQDRTRWDARQIEVGMTWLARSAHGEVYSRYHAEAAVAAEHCLARSFKETNWERVASGYAMLEQVAPSPLHRLNRALAIAESRGAHAGLEVLDACDPPEWLARSYMWWAALSDLHRRAGNADIADGHRARAVAGAPSDPIRVLLERRLGQAE